MERLEGGIQESGYGSIWLAQSVKACNSWSQDREFKRHAGCGVYSQFYKKLKFWILYGRDRGPYKFSASDFFIFSFIDTYCA